MAQQLQAGKKAPEILVTSAQGETIRLNAYQGKKVLLVFFRFAGCPVCNFKMHELIDRYEELKANNLEVLAVFESSNATLLTYVQDAHIPFPVIGDSSLVLYKRFHVTQSVFKMMNTMFKKKPKAEMKKGEALYHGKKYKQDGSLTRIPADFIIDEQGLLKMVHYGKFIGDHLPIETILKQ